MEKNEKFETFLQNFINKRKNCKSDVECYKFDNKNQKISEIFKYDLEKNEISKSAETSKYKIELYMTKEKFCSYAKDKKNSNEKNNMNKNIKEYRTQKNENKNNYKIKNNKLKKNEIYENKPNKYYEDIKKIKLKENNIYKRKLYINDYIDDYIDNKNKLENIKIKKKKKYKFNIIYIIILNIIFFSQFIKCFNRKIELASSYINLKVIGNGTIIIYSNDFNEEKPNIVSINNLINLTGTNNHYTFNNSENNINNITLIWNRPPSSTRNLFSYCTNITEIDLSYFDTSQVNYMNSMFSDCSNLISLNLSNFNTSSVTSMSSMFNGWAKLESLDLSYFDTSQVNNMYGMFSGCSNLLSLNLSNFNISGVSSISSMFNGCNRLEYVDLINTKINPNIIPDSTFSNLPSNLYICSENEDWAKIFNLLDKQYVNCINNISYFNINENENVIKCKKRI